MAADVIYDVRQEMRMWTVFRDGEFFWQGRPGTTSADADAVASGAGQHESELAPFPGVDVKKSDGSVLRFGTAL